MTINQKSILPGVIIKNWLGKSLILMSSHEKIPAIITVVFGMH